MAGETEVLGEYLPRRHFVHHKSHLTRPGIEPGLPRWITTIFHTLNLIHTEIKYTGPLLPFAFFTMKMAIPT
jgi:hypothetical protein